MANTRTEIDTDDELIRLKALVAEQQERLDALDGHIKPLNGVETKDNKRSTRRQLLKLAGATIAGAAGSAALRAIPASAADGNTVTVGTVFGEQTGLTTGVSSLGYVVTNAAGALAGWAHAGRGVWGYAASGEAVHANVYGGGTGVTAIGNGVGAGIGVNAFGNGTGVVAGGGAYGVAASGTTGVLGTGAPGVRGSSATGVGVHGTTSAAGTRAVYGYASGAGSAGVQAKSILGYGGVLRGTGGLFAGGLTYNGIFTYSTGLGFAGLVAGGFNGGPDAVLNGSGRLVQYNHGYGGTYGGPNFTPSTIFLEMLRTRDGGMWISRGIAGGVGQAAWKRVNAVRVDSADGTGKAFTPFRLFDSRSGTKPAKGSITTVSVVNQGVGTSNIPSDAIAVIGNLTATQYAGGGFLTISPAGIFVTTSTVNFITGQLAIANSFVVGLGTGGAPYGGKLWVKVSGAASHFIVDITGYIQ